jgi:hypothetical protein
MDNVPVTLHAPFEADVPTGEFVLHERLGRLGR